MTLFFSLCAQTVLVIDNNTDISHNIAAGIGSIVSSRDFVNLRHWGVREGTYVSAGHGVTHPDCPPIKKHIRFGFGFFVWVCVVLCCVSQCVCVTERALAVYVCVCCVCVCCVCVWQRSLAVCVLRMCACVAYVCVCVHASWMCVSVCVHVSTWGVREGIYVCWTWSYPPWLPSYRDIHQVLVFCLFVCVCCVVYVCACMHVCVCVCAHVSTCNTGM